MLSHQTVINIWEATQRYQELKADSKQILPVLTNADPEEYAYLISCLSRVGIHYAKTTEHVLEFFPRHIAAMGLEYLIELLCFPWKGWVHEICPICVVIGIAERQGFLSSADAIMLHTSVQDYLEKYPESAPDEFLFLHELNPSLAENLWHGFSESLKDEVAHRYLRRKSERDLRRFARAIDIRRLSYSEASVFDGIAKAFDALAKIPILSIQSIADSCRLLLVLSSQPDINSALPFLRPWINAKSALFANRIWRAGTDFSAQHSLVNEQGEPKEGRSHTDTSEDTTIDLQRLQTLAELAQQFRDIGFVAAQHVPLLHNLTPSEFCYLWAEKDTYPRLANYENLIQCLVPQFIDAFGPDFLFDVMQCPTIRRERPAERFILVYETALANGLLSERHRAQFIEAFSRFLNSHPETSAQEFLSIYRRWWNCMTETFATGVFIALTPEIKANIERGFEETIVEDLKMLVYEDRLYDFFGRRTMVELEEEPPVESIERAEKTSSQTETARASARTAYRAFLQQIQERRIRHDTAFELGGVISFFSALALTVPEQGRSEDEQHTRFLLCHALSSDFARPGYFHMQKVKPIVQALARSGTALVDNPVFVGVSVPLSVVPGSQFVARLYAYVEEWQTKAEEALKTLAPTSIIVPSLRMCRWKIGETVVVRIKGEHFSCEEPKRKFEWNGAFEIVDFTLTLHENAPVGIAVLGFNVEIACVRVASIRIEIEVSKKKPEPLTQRVTIEAARTGFASYASHDRYEVMGRVSSIEQSTGMHVFVDCLDLLPSKRWMPVLREEICVRDIFLLFWSVNAGRSKWVTWEWKTALENKHEDSMQIHALQPPHLAPAPVELAHLHFGDRFIIARSPFGP